ncbi:MAG: hypothetical protein K6G52_00100 [Treponemataceae bacterium]|nr:hypothetical protein [Treponemataceae bacterium]
MSEKSQKVKNIIQLIILIVIALGLITYLVIKPLVSKERNVILAFDEGIKIEKLYENISNGVLQAAIDYNQTAFNTVQIKMVQEISGLQELAESLGQAELIILCTKNNSENLGKVESVFPKTKILQIDAGKVEDDTIFSQAGTDSSQKDYGYDLMMNYLLKKN